jgi:hypothetical protein
MKLALSITLLSLLLSGRALADDAPIALDKWGRYHVNITPYMPSISPGKIVKWVPKVSLVFKVQKPESDDIVELQHFQGKKKWGPVQKCKLESQNLIKKREKGGVEGAYSLVVPTCLMDEAEAIAATGAFSVEVSYKQTGAGKLHSKLGVYRYTVKNHNGVWGYKAGPTKLYHVDHDFRIGEAWAYLNAEGQLQVWTWFKYDRKGESDVRGGRLRCSVGDKQLELYEKPTGRTTVEFDYYPTRDKNEKTFWGLWYFWTKNSYGAEFLKANPGSYRCTLTAAGEVSRELSFEVADGLVKRAPCQGDGLEQVRSLDEEALIKVQLKKATDLAYDKAALRKAGLYGRKWGKGCPP